MIIFIFSCSRPLPSYFVFKRSHNGIFLIFRIFLLFFFEFSIMRRVGRKRNDNFYFGLKWSHNGFFLIFWLFLKFFGNFLLRIGLERNNTMIFIYSPSQPFPAYCGLKWSHYGIFFNLLNCFFAIFWEFSLTCRARMKRNNNFYFLSSLVFSDLFWLEMKS